MKSSILALSLLGLAAAQPHRHAQHAAFHEKRDVVVETQIVTATALDDVIVWVDAEGNPVATSYPGQAAPTQAAVAATSVAPAPVAAVTTAVPAPAPTSVVAAAAAPAVQSVAANNKVAAAGVPFVPAAQSSSSAPSSSGSSGSSGLLGSILGSGSSSSDGVVKGVGYSPYTQSGACKTAPQVAADFDRMDTSFNLVRIYGTDCGQASTVLAAAKAKGMKVFAGVFDISQVQSEVATIIAAANGDWSSFHTVSVGNELVNNGEATPAAVASAVNAARTQLRAAGYNGPVLSVDTFTAMIAHPELCNAGDYVAVNAHAFFDHTATAAIAGTWTKTTQDAVSLACGGKKTLISECGWPAGGICNGAACPSPDNQRTAISSINSTYANQDVIMFSAFNDLWKQNSADTFDSERFWGIFGTSSS